MTRDFLFRVTLIATGITHVHLPLLPRTYHYNPKGFKVFSPSMWIDWDGDRRSIFCLLARCRARIFVRGHCLLQKEKTETKSIAVHVSGEREAKLFHVIVISLFLPTSGDFFTTIANLNKCRNQKQGVTVEKFRRTSKTVDGEEWRRKNISFF